MATNPSPGLMPNGSIFVIYKGIARQGDFMRRGVARAAAWNNWDLDDRAKLPPLDERNAPRPAGAPDIAFHDRTEVLGPMKGQKRHTSYEIGRARAR
ncbi:MAG: hypothetical protein EXS37_14760 [Opitutus sp.]|nr:hypothetical protein [Opitutus sp.]